MQRWLRGEKLSAARFVQGHALDRLIELDDSLAEGADAAAGVDPFTRERRLEQRRPELARELPQLAPGYLATPQAALAMLAALERRGVAVDEAMKEQIGRQVEAATAASDAAP
jgi:hypothetical protein